MTERWNPVRRLVAIALWSAANVMDATATEVMPPKKARVVKPKVARPAWWSDH